MIIERNLRIDLDDKYICFENKYTTFIIADNHYLGVHETDDLTEAVEFIRNYQGFYEVAKIEYRIIASDEDGNEFILECFDIDCEY